MGHEQSPKHRPKRGGKPSQPSSEAEQAERVQKLIASAGIASRRAAEELIRAGRVTISGRRAQLGDRAQPGEDRVAVDGDVIRSEALSYWLLHKPVGVVSTLADIGQVAPPEGAQGQSLLPAIDGDEGGSEYVFSSIEDWTGVRDEGYRFTVDNPTGIPCELYDLTRDPRELNNFVEDSEYAAIVARFKEIVLKHHAQPG